MPRAKQGTPRAGYHHVTLLDRRGRVLAYADSLAVSGTTIGLVRAGFSRLGIVRLTTGRERVTVRSGGRTVLVVNGLRLTTYSGGKRARDGTWACEAAIGTIRSGRRRGV